jgi:butyryl-CoA dehydrogenase
MADLFHMLSEEERAFLAVLGRLCADRIAPQAAETDEDSRFVHPQIALLAETGMLGANLPEPHGPGISAQCLLGAVEIVAGACASTASALTAHYLATDSLHLGGDAAIQARYLPAAAEGRALGAFALTERNAGSDPADMKTRALREGDGYRLKGAKCFISNGGVADFIVVYAVTDPAAGHRGISAFVVDKGTPGFTPGRAERTMGLRGGHVWELDFDCWLPEENRLGPEGTGFRTAMKVLDNGRRAASSAAWRWPTARASAGSLPTWRPTLPQRACWRWRRRASARAVPASPRRPRWPSFSPRKCATASPTPPCNCTAATASPATCPLNAMPAIAASCASTRAHPKSSARSSLATFLPERFP